MAGQDFTQRNRREVYARAVRTTHPSAVDLTIARSKTVMIHISMEAITGTSITFTITAKDPVTGRATAAAVLASAAITAAGYSTLTIGPGVATVSNVSLQAIAPRVLSIVPTGTFSSAEYVVTAELID